MTDVMSATRHRPLHHLKEGERMHIAALTTGREPVLEPLEEPSGPLMKREDRRGRRANKGRPEANRIRTGSRGIALSRHGGPTGTQRPRQTQPRATKRRTTSSSELRALTDYEPPKGVLMLQQPYVAIQLAEQHQRDLLTAAARKRNADGAHIARSGVEAQLQVQLLGPFSVALGTRVAGPWERPTAKRLCELVFVSPGRRVGRDVACEELFSNLAPREAAKALSKALSMARASLARLGSSAERLLQGDRTFIWADLALVAELDLESHERSLRSALGAERRADRDELLVNALERSDTLLEDEPFASWAIAPRERLEALRQQARLALARGRAGSEGQADHGLVIEAWEQCLAHDPTSEEAGSALIRAYGAQANQGMVDRTYKRCRTALEELGVYGSPLLEEAYDAAVVKSGFLRGVERAATSPREERRLVTAVFAELAVPAGSTQGPEGLAELVVSGLSDVVAEMEAFGGTVTAVTGTGVVALFGAHESHEDDPERALRAALKAVAATGHVAGGLSLRAGVETGPTVVRSIGGTGHCAAVGNAVGVAAALQFAASPASVLVGPETRAAAEGLFDWGAPQLVPVPTNAEPLRATYLERPRARPNSFGRPKSLLKKTPLMGREPEMRGLLHALQDVESGQGGVVVVSGEPGLGKTRMLEECRRLFIRWVEHDPGRLPLWLSGRAVPHMSLTPYGLYQRLLSTWVGVGPEDGDVVVQPALERALKALFGSDAGGERLSPLFGLMGLSPGKGAPLAQHGSGQLLRASLTAIRSMVSRLARYGPTVLLLEDLQWADPISLQVTEALFPLVQEVPLLIIITHRPEHGPRRVALGRALAAIPSARAVRVQLRPLSRAAERELARSLLLGEVSDEVLDEVIEGADGNPLLLEERLKSLLEAKVLVEADDGWRLGPTLLTEPSDVIKRLVQSRLDLLGSSQREIIVAASVLEPEFTLESLRAVTGPRTDLVQTVAELRAGGLLRDVRRFPQPTYCFNHAMFREVIYQGLLGRQRRLLEARAASVLDAG
jgi:class 3 adenylate cyclase